MKARIHNMLNSDEMKQKNLLKFISALTKIETIEIIGTARLLGASLIGINSEELNQLEKKDFSDVLADMLDRFSKLNLDQQRALLKILKAAK